MPDIPGWKAQHEALTTLRQQLDAEDGARLYACWAGVEGTISQGVRAFRLRQARYRGLQKMHLQHVVTAAAINLARLGAWGEGRPHAGSRVSRFTRLAA